MFNSSTLSLVEVDVLAADKLFQRTGAAQSKEEWSTAMEKKLLSLS